LHTIKNIYGRTFQLVGDILPFLGENQLHFLKKPCGSGTSLCLSNCSLYDSINTKLLPVHKGILFMLILSLCSLHF